MVDRDSKPRLDHKTKWPNEAWNEKETKCLEDQFEVKKHLIYIKTLQNLLKNYVLGVAW